MTRNDLENLIRRISGKPYLAYKDLRGRYDFGGFMLSIDRVQGDPFAAPSRLSISIDHQNSKLPPALFSNRSRRIGAENYLARAFSKACHTARAHLGSGKSGLLAIDAPGQELLERNCVVIGGSRTIVNFMAGLPANGRRINGHAAAQLLIDTIPALVDSALLYQNLDTEQIRRYAETSEDADFLRAELESLQLVAFVADDAILPRASGIDQRPLADAVPFHSPDSLRATIALPNAGEVSGMGIREGITLIVGGGFHGKSTLLNALERGVYNHRPGDGREFVVTRADAVKSRTEDGRSIAEVDLSPFINNLPGGKDTVRFRTENASGSTSQAAGIVEALEIGASALLIDEDISATNFLIRDARMQRLIAPELEPITPFVERVAELHQKRGVSTIIVMGGSSAYFEAAHLVIGLDSYRPLDLTQQAKELCSPITSSSTSCSHSWSPAPRRADPASISPYKSAPSYRGSHGGRDHSSRPPRQRIVAHDTRSLEFGSNEIDLSLLSQIVDTSQVRAIGAALAYTLKRGTFEEFPIARALAETIADLEANGLGLLDANDLAAIRLPELAAALNRLRSLRCR